MISQPEVMRTPKGLFWRGDTLWISKTIRGKRYQFSTGEKTLEGGMQVFEDFLRKKEAEREPATKKPRNRSRLPKGLYWKGNVIWLSRVVNGKHFNVSTGTANVSLAMKFLEDFNTKAFKGEKLGVSAKRKIAAVELADRYIEEGRVNGLRPKTLARYSAVRDHFVAFLKQRRKADVAAEIGPEVIEDYKSWRASTPLNRNGHPVNDPKNADSTGASPKTLQLEVQTIGTFFKHGVRLKLVDENPVARTRPVRLKKATPIYLEIPEVRALLKAASTYNEWAMPQPTQQLLHDVILVYLKTGMRLEELRNLEKDDIRFGEICVAAYKIIKMTRTIPLKGIQAD